MEIGIVWDGEGVEIRIWRLGLNGMMMRGRRSEYDEGEGEIRIGRL